MRTKAERWLRFSPEVREAMDAGRAVVAVESTILTHGLSLPRALELAFGVDRAIRDRGAVPAFTALMEGELRIGLNRDEMERLAAAEGRVKLTSADLGIGRARGQTGGTTAAATAWMAAQAGIRVALAGGLGGVHRDVLDTWDISGDLNALAASGVLMVCGGIKTFLDIGKTLEALETLGVPVLTYGQDRFPGYYVKESAFSAVRVDSGEEAARLAAAHWEIGMTGGLLLGVPIPDEAALPRDRIEAVIRRVLSETAGTGDGKGVTPRLIRAIERETDGRTAQANRALIVAAARVAADAAVALASFGRQNGA